MRTAQEPGGSPLEESEVAERVRHAMRSGSLQHISGWNIPNDMDQWAWDQGDQFYQEYVAALESGREGTVSSGPAAASGVDAPAERSEHWGDAEEFSSARIRAGTGEPVTAANAAEVAVRDAAASAVFAGARAAINIEAQKGGKQAGKGHRQAARGSAQAKGDRQLPGHLPGWQVKGKGRSRSSKGSDPGAGPPQPSAPPGAPPSMVQLVLPLHLKEKQCPCQI